MAAPYDIDAQIADFHKRVRAQARDDQHDFILGELVAEMKRMRDALESVVDKLDSIENKMA